MELAWIYSKQFPHGKPPNSSFYPSYFFGGHRKHMDFSFFFFFSFIMLTWVHRKITGTFFNLLCLVSNDFGCFWGVRYLSCLFLKFTVQLHKKLLIFQMSPNFKSVYLGEETSVSTLVFCFCRPLGGISW